MRQDGSLSLWSAQQTVSSQPSKPLLCSLSHNSIYFFVKVWYTLLWSIGLEDSADERKKDMRTVLFCFLFALYLIVSIPFMLIFRLVGCFNRRAGVACSQKMVVGAFRIVMTVTGYKLTVLGQENIPDVPCLFTADHRSYFDIPLAYVTVGHLTGFIAKKEIAKVPSLNWWMKNMNCLFLDRNDTRQALKVILAAIDNIKAGYSVFVMPEGTRNHEPELLPFKEGTFKIAEKAACPIVPVAISNTDAIYELHRPWIRKAKVVIHYGKPIMPEDITKEERKCIGARVRGIVADMMEEDRKYL